MIKNNFIITEEDKSHILKLTRLPNFKNPITLKEDNGDSGLNITWKSSKNKEVADSETLKSNLEKYKQGGRFTQLDFSDATRVEQAYNNLVSYINMNYRGNVVNYFYRALLVADKIFPNNGYGTMGQDLKNISDDKTIKLKPKSGSATYNTMINPPEDEEGLYQVAYLKAPFGGVPIWKIKRILDSELGKPGTTERVPDNSSETGSNIELAQDSVIEYLDSATRGYDSELNDSLCIDTLQFYLNKVVNKQYPVSGEKLRTLKKTIAYCNTNIKYDPARQQGLFKKIKNKTSGNVYGKLKKKTRALLDDLQYRNDEFKVNITDPDRN